VNSERVTFLIMNETEATAQTPPQAGLIGLIKLPEIPDHQLLQRIGRGSYGEVWLARSVTGAYRAVKIVRRESFEHERPFEREFSGILQFEPISRTHQSQVDILHVGKGEGYFYYVMELADDQRTGRQINPDSYAPKTLKSELFQRGKLPFEECVQISLALTTALENLHSHGLVHRDVKPSNIIFVNGIPKLADIGLVTGSDATRSHVGTEGFAPPEGPGSAQADLYSLGKVCYEMATGKDRQDFPELPTNLAELPECKGLVELNTVIAKACREQPRERYQSASAMQADLALLERGKSVRRVHSLRHRLRLLTKVCALVAILALLVFGINWWLEYRVQQIQTRPLIGQGRLAGKIPERDPAAKAVQIDLSNFYNGLLTETWLPGPGGNDLSRLASGLQQLAGVRFDVRGVIQLKSAEIIGLGEELFPERVTGIKVGLRCQRLHFLEGTVSGAADGTAIGSYLVEYANGRRQEIPIVYGKSVRDFWVGADQAQNVEPASIAWKGQNAATEQRGYTVQLYKQTWENPLPDLKISAITFASGRTRSAPFLIAVTAEQATDFAVTPKEDFVAVIQAQADVFKRIEVERTPGRNEFQTVALNVHNICVNGMFYDAIRFTTPPYAGWHLVWAWASQSASNHSESWSIVPVSGGIKVGFEEWYHGQTGQYQNFADLKDGGFTLQFLDGRKLQPNSDYLIWFSFHNGQPQESKIAIHFVPPGQADPSNIESLEKALGLTPVSASTTASQPRSHRHFCIGTSRW